MYGGQASYYALLLNGFQDRTIQSLSKLRSVTYKAFTIFFCYMATMPMIISGSTIFLRAIVQNDQLMDMLTNCLMGHKKYL